MNVFYEILKKLCPKSYQTYGGPISNTIEIKNKNGDVIGSGNIIINNYYGHVEKPQVIPMVINKDIEETDEHKLDIQTVINLFTYFSTNVMDNYLRHEPTDIETRVVSIKDYWDAIINASSFIIYNAETDRLIRDFYNPFAAIISDGGMDYGPNEMKPHYYRFWGYERDTFTTYEREKKYYEYVKRIQELAPLYYAMIDHIKKVYKLDLASLSENFEKENEY